MTPYHNVQKAYKQTIGRLQRLESVRSYLTTEASLSKIFKVIILLMSTYNCTTKLIRYISLQGEQKVLQAVSHTSIFILTVADGGFSLMTF